MSFRNHQAPGSSLIALWDHPRVPVVTLAFSQPPELDSEDRSGADMGQGFIICRQKSDGVPPR